MRLPVDALRRRRIQRVHHGSRLAQTGGDAFAGDRVGKAGGIAHQEDTVRGHHRRPIPEWPDGVDRADPLRVPQPRTDRLHDLAVASLQSPAEFTHPRLVAEQGDHTLAAGDRALVDLQPIGEGDAHPGVERTVDLPVGDDAVAMRRTGPDGPAQPMSER